MKVFDAWGLTSILYRIEWARTEHIRYEINSGHRDSLVSKEAQDGWLDALVKDARDLALKAELPSTSSRVNESGGLPIGLADGLTYQELDHQLKVLRESIQFDLDTKHVYIVESEKQKYNTTDFLLETWGAPSFYFPSVRKDAMAAMRAYVRDLNTACVFHLMRITEIGLRALARRMRIRLAKNKPLEWAQWNTIIIEMNKKTDVIANQKASHSRDELLEFYRGAIGEVTGYKDAYRNFVMHMKEKSEYDHNEARSLIDRVSHFMQRLSGKIDEAGHVLTEALKKKMLDRVSAQIAEEKRKADEEAKQGVRELRSDNAAISASTAQRDQSQTGCGESSKKAEG